MDREESRTARLRQAVDDANVVVDDSSVAFAAVVFDTAPWSDEELVARALRRWADRYWGEGALEPGQADGAGQVAQHMRVLGSASTPPTSRQMVGIAFLMLRNVASGRGPLEYDMLRQHVIGIAPRTERRYRQRARDAGRNPEVDPFLDYMERVQYDLDLAGLMRKGRSEAAARRWLQRNPGRHAMDAPPPRRRCSR